MMRALALCGLLAASSAVPIYNLTDGAQGPYGARPTPVPTLILWRAPQPLLDYCVGSSRALSVALSTSKAQVIRCPSSF